MNTRPLNNTSYSLVRTVDTNKAVVLCDASSFEIVFANDDLLVELISLLRDLLELLLERVGRAAVLLDLAFGLLARRHVALEEAALLRDLLAARPRVVLRVDHTLARLRLRILELVDPLRLFCQFSIHRSHRRLFTVSQRNLQT